MELTTQQLHAIFAMLTVAAIAGLVFYCVGLRTGKGIGYEQGRANSTTYWKKIVGNVSAKLGEARDLLDARTREMATLRQCIEQETADHQAAMATLKQHMHFTENDREGVIRDLLAELQHERANRLTTDDWLNIKLAAKQLGIAAHQHARSGSAKTNQPAQAQACITALAERVKATLDQPPRLCEYASDSITDTDLIEWLEQHREEWRFDEGHYLSIPYDDAKLQGDRSVRNVLKYQMQQAQGYWVIEPGDPVELMDADQRTPLFGTASLSLNDMPLIGTGTLHIRPYTGPLHAGVSAK